MAAPNSLWSRAWFWLISHGVVVALILLFVAVDVFVLFVVRPQHWLQRTWRRA